MAELDETKKLFPELDDTPDAHRKRMVHAVTRYDRKQEESAAKNPKRYHNIYALGHYIGAVDRAHEDMKKGHSPAAAINNNFTGSLANHLHKSLGTGDVDIDTKRRKHFGEETTKLVESYGHMSPEAQELVLHGDNTAHLYHQSQAPIQKNLSKKFRKGIYNHDMAHKLWKYHADRVAQDHASEYGDPGKWHQTFSPEHRREAARHWADHWHGEMKAGNLHEQFNHKDKEETNGETI